VRRLIFMISVAALLLPAAADEKKASNPYALIFGTVFGPDERLAQGVPIVIRRADNKKKRWELVSDARGEFAQRVPAGKADYVVEPRLKDKQLIENSRVIVHIQNEERQDIALHLNGEQKVEKK
jgi:hypothetical protein